MQDTDHDDEIILEIRRRSTRLVQTAFATLALLALAAGLAVHHFPDQVTFVEEAPEAVANCFLVMGLCYAATLLMWEWLFAEDA